MPASIARKSAFDVLLRVESESAYASDLLHSALTPGIKSFDAALATELTLGVLRWRRLLDFFLDRQLKKPIERLDLPVAVALRMGFYQLRFLGKIPERAAVNESVELVKRSRKSSAASLVNAVLRRASADAKLPAEKLLPPNLPLADRLGIVHSHPTWIVERWLGRFGEASTHALLDANNRAPRLALVLHDPEQRDQVLRMLESSGLKVQSGRLLKNALIASGGSVTRTKAFRAGQVSIQDEASQTVPLLLGVRPGDCVLDLCAAPGGKTIALAQAAGSRGMVVAGELHAHRLRSMREQLARLRIAFTQCATEIAPLEEGSGRAHSRASGVHLVAFDAAQPLPFATGFNRILVDAPCSGTGTLARHPEIRWRLRPERLAEFHALQVRLLCNAFAQIQPGGRLVYSTCSMEQEENESVISEALTLDGSIRLVPAGESERILAPHLPAGIASTSLFDSRGFFRTSPAAHRTDGFFAAVLEKPQ